MAEFPSNTTTDLSTQFATDTRMWPEPLNSAGQTLAEWVAVPNPAGTFIPAHRELLNVAGQNLAAWIATSPATNNENNFVPTQTSDGRLVSDGESILFNSNTNSIITIDRSAIRVIEDPFANNSFFGNRYNQDGQGTGTGNAITITNSQIHGVTDGGASSTNVAMTFTNVDWYQFGPSLFIGNWGVGGGEATRWLINGLRAFGGTTDRVTSLNILLANTTADSEFNDVSFYNGNPTAPLGAYLETASGQIWQNTVFGPIGRSYDLTGGFNGDARLLARLGPVADNTIATSITPLLGWDWRDASQVNDVNFVISGDVGNADVNTRNVTLLMVNPLVGRPGGTGNVLLRKGVTPGVGVLNDPPQSLIRFVVGVGTRPVTTDTGNTFHRYIPAESSQNVFAAPASFDNTTDITNAAGGIVDNPANGLVFQVLRRDAAGDELGDDAATLTAQAYPTLSAIGYRKYSWLQQPDNNTFGQRLTVTPPTEGATDAQVTESRNQGYSEFTNNGLSTLTNVDDPADVLIASLGETFAQVTARYERANGLENYDMFVGGFKAFQMNRSSRGNHFELPYIINGNTLQLSDATIIDGTATDMSNIASVWTLPSVTAPALGATIRGLDPVGALEFRNGAAPAAGTILGGPGGGQIAGLATTPPAITFADGLHLNYNGESSLDFRNVTFPETGTITVTTGTTTTIENVRDEDQSKLVAGAGTTLNVLGFRYTTTIQTPAEDGFFGVLRVNSDDTTTVITPATATNSTTRGSYTIVAGDNDNYRFYWKKTNTADAPDGTGGTIEGVGYFTTTITRTNVGLTGDTTETMVATPIFSALYSGDRGTLGATTVGAPEAGTTAATNGGIQLLINNPNTNTDTGAGPSQFAVLSAADTARYLNVLLNNGLTEDFLVPPSVGSATIDARYGQLNTATAGQQQRLVGTEFINLGRFVSEAFTDTTLGVARNDTVLATRARWQLRDSADNFITLWPGGSSGGAFNGQYIRIIEPSGQETDIGNEIVERLDVPGVTAENINGVISSNNGSFLLAEFNFRGVRVSGGTGGADRVIDIILVVEQMLRLDLRIHHLLVQLIIY